MNRTEEWVIDVSIVVNVVVNMGTNMAAPPVTPPRRRVAVASKIIVRVVAAHERDGAHTEAGCGRRCLKDGVGQQYRDALGAAISATVAEGRLVEVAGSRGVRYAAPPVARPE